MSMVSCIHADGATSSNLEFLVMLGIFGNESFTFVIIIHYVDRRVCVRQEIALYKLWSVTGAAICRILEYRPQFILVYVKIFSLKSQSFQAKTPLNAVILCVLCHFLLCYISL